jgi:hypothetical protein
MKPSRLYLILTLVLFLSLPLLSQVRFSGNLQSALYAWENTAENKLFDFYQYAQFRLQPSPNPNLYFGTYFRFARRGQQRLSGDKIYAQGEDVYDWEDRLYNLYVNWKTVNNRLLFRLGRQFVYQGVINGTLDGLMVSAKATNDLTLKVFAGLEAPDTREFKLRKTDEGTALGGYLSYRLPWQNKVDVSYFQKSRKVAKGSTEETETVWQLLGLAFTGQTNNLYYQAYYDHNLKSKEFQGMRYRFTYYWRQWSILGEYNSQRPRLYEDSFFRVFKIDAYNQIRAGVTYDINRYQVGLQYIFTDIHYNESNQFLLSLGNLWGLIGLVLQTGDAGKNVGAYGQIRYPIHDQFTAKAFASYYNFERQTTVISEDAVGLSAGLEYRPIQLVSVDAEVQQTNNSLFKSDTRGLFRLNIFF